MRTRLLYGLGLLLLLSAIWVTCQPGIRGGFLFDDYANLPSLGATGPIDNAPAFWRYVTSGNADPTGRPIAVASFLLDARNWPANPHPFKRTNLLIELFNTVLLAAFLLALGRQVGLDEAHARRAALLGAAFWGLHPLFISTTFYIVQREAMLAATFVLIGLLSWLSGRRRLLAGQWRSGLALEWAGLGVGTLLAVLSKANGALLPALALLIEWMLLRPRDSAPIPRSHRWTIRLLAILPTALIIAYLTYTGVHLAIATTRPFGRPWTEIQRLLSEPRILWDYLKLLWLPRPYTPGLFNDQIHASTGLLRPWTTLPALAGILGLIAAVILLRRRAPLWAFVLAFFLVGQAIESTTIPLELYFEHRNYLPALPMFWPLAIGLTRTGQRWPFRAVLAAGIILMLAAMTHSRAVLWGTTDTQALMWARLNPASPRAQAYAAQLMVHQGHPSWAVRRLRPLLKKDRRQIQIAFNLIGADCALGYAPPGDLKATRKAIQSTRILGELSFNWISGAIAKAKSGQCRGLTLPVVESFIRAAWNNPVTRKTLGWQQNVLNLQAQFALANNRPDVAYVDLVKALRINPRPGAALQQAATLGDYGHQKLGLCELNQYRGGNVKAPLLSMARVHQWVLKQQGYWPHEIRYLRNALQRTMPRTQRNISCPVVPPKGGPKTLLDPDSHRTGSGSTS